MNTTDFEELLAEFLERWDIENINNLTLQNYVGLGNKDTFCQWVETKTKLLGSIKGWSSIKFGIYERKTPNKKPKNYKNDDSYSWLKTYSDNRKIVFEEIKKDIINIIKFSETGKFELIDDIRLPGLFKWKVAFLYSNERLIPIFKKAALFKIATHFGLQANKHTKISEIQSLMMQNKPVDLNVYQFMRQLYDRFGDKGDKEEMVDSRSKKGSKTKRKPSKNKNTSPQIRTPKGSYIAEQKHNKIQLALQAILIDKYGSDNVLLEENNVDIKLLQPNFIAFYEVKSDSYATGCIEKALGQILRYSLNDTDKREKKYFIVGQYSATENDKRYIDFLKKMLNFEFDYFNVEIN
jgi:hypothetical protein